MKVTCIIIVMILLIKASPQLASPMGDCQPDSITALMNLGNIEREERLREILTERRALAKELICFLDADHSAHQRASACLLLGELRLEDGIHPLLQHIDFHYPRSLKAAERQIPLITQYPAMSALGRMRVSGGTLFDFIRTEHDPVRRNMAGQLILNIYGETEAVWMIAAEIQRYPEEATTLNKVLEFVRSKEDDKR